MEFLTYLTTLDQYQADSRFGNVTDLEGFNQQFYNWIAGNNDLILDLAFKHKNYLEITITYMTRKINEI